MGKAEFWNWFEENLNQLEYFMISKSQDYTIYDELTEKLQDYNELLIPELYIDEYDKFVLIISCDGVREGIPAVENLMENIKSYEGWTIRKFRSQTDFKTIPYRGVNLNKKDILLKWEANEDGKFDLDIFIIGFHLLNDDLKAATFLHLDHCIGEYNMMTRIGYVEISMLGFFQSKKGLRNLNDLKLHLNELDRSN